ncbi:hypothetical protein ACWCP8_36935 [Streptomyces sp. NPDC002206]
MRADSFAASLAEAPRQCTAKPADFPQAAAELAGARLLKVRERGKRILDVDKKGVGFGDGEPESHASVLVVRTRVGVGNGVADQDPYGLRGAFNVPRPPEHRQPRPCV